MGSRKAKDLTYELRKLDNDTRPWYRKGWPYVRKGQRVKLITSGDKGILEPHRKPLMRRTVLWRNRLSTQTCYDFKEKMIVLEEVVPELEPSEYVGQEHTQAKLEWLKDEKGSIIETLEVNRVERGDYHLIYITLYTANWPNYSMKLFEENLVHELLHVLYPRKAFFLRKGLLYENQREMRRFTTDIIEKNNQPTTKRKV